MKRSRLSITLILLLISSFSFAQDKVVKLCEDPWPPWTIGEMGESPIGGFAVKITHKIFERIKGAEPNMQLLPWKRCLRDIELGRMDGYLMALYTEERAQYLIVSDPFLTSRALLYYLVSKYPKGIKWKTFNDLSPYVIGDVIGYSTSPEWDEAIKNNIFTAEKVKTDELNFKKLLKGRLDLALFNEQIANEFINKFGAEDKVDYAKKPVKVTLYRMALGKKSPHLQMLPKINQVIGELQAEGAIDEIKQGKP